MFSILCLFCYSYFWFLKPANGNLSGSITADGTILTRYTSALSSSFSPACGTMKKENQVWRGASFFSSSIRLETNSKNGTFSFVSPFPPFSTFEPQMDFKVTIIKFLGKTSDNGIETWVEMDKLCDSTYTNDKITFRKTFDGIYVLHLFGTNNINIKQYGEIPYGAWNPFEGAQIKIDNRLNYISLEENYTGFEPAHHLDSNGVTVITENPFKKSPILDLMGKPLLIWYDSEESSVSLNDDTLISQMNTNINNTSNERELIAIILEPPSTIRIITFGFTKNEKYKDDLRLFSYSMPIEKESCIQKLIIAKDDDIEKKLEDATAYLNKEGRIFVAENIKINNRTWKGMSFSYPKLPEHWGLFLWGEVPELSIENARGAVVLNSDTKQIGAKSHVEISGIKNLNNEQGFISFYSNGTNDFKADFKSFYINGAIAYTNWDRYGIQIGIVSVLITIIGIFTPILFKKITENVAISDLNKTIEITSTAKLPIESVNNITTNKKRARKKSRKRRK